MKSPKDSAAPKSYPDCLKMAIFSILLFLRLSGVKVLLSFHYPAQIAFSVSKRGFRLAVTRNLIKRRMREAYRKNKYLLYEFLASENKQIVLIVIVKGE